MLKFALFCVLSYYFIGKNLLLFGKQLHTIQMPDIANEQEQAFMKAMRNAAKIFQMEGMLKSLQDIKPVQSPIIGGNKRSMELGD